MFNTKKHPDSIILIRFSLKSLARQLNVGFEWFNRNTFVRKIRLIKARVSKRKTKTPTRINL